jgi:hypothetical protein
MCWMRAWLLRSYAYSTDNSVLDATRILLTVHFVVLSVHCWQFTLWCCPYTADSSLCDATRTLVTIYFVMLPLHSWQFTLWYCAYIAEHSLCDATCALLTFHFLIPSYIADNSLCDVTRTLVTIHNMHNNVAITTSIYWTSVHEYDYERILRLRL